MYMILKYIQQFHKILPICIGLFLCILVWWISSDVSAQVVHECDAQVTPEKFADKIIESILPDDERVFYTRNNLEKVWKSFDTFCCRSGLLDDESCDEKDHIYNDDLLINGSPYLIEHLLWVVRMYVWGDKTECDRYDLDCENYIEQENGYPGLWVCRRNGADEDWGDTLCNTKYDIQEWIDTMLADTEPSIPGEITWLYQKLRISGEGVWIKSMPSLDERNPREYTMSHLLRRTCDEVVWIANLWALSNDRFLSITDLDLSGTHSGKSERWLCQTYMKELMSQNANYAIIGSQHAAVYLLDNHRDTMMERTIDLLTSMIDMTNKFVWAVTEVLNRKWDYAPQQCSVA